MGLQADRPARTRGCACRLTRVPHKALWCARLGAVMKAAILRGLRASALAGLFLVTTAGVPTNGIPTNGIPTNGVPTNGIPTNGIPTNGIPTNGANLDALETSLIFGNRAVHLALIGRPFTQANLTDTSSPVIRVWEDEFSTILLSYLWQDAHGPGDDLVFTSWRGDTFHFYGNVGLCDKGGTGWAKDTPLDESCARWLSAAIIAQVNQSGIHNIFSARGPSSAAGPPFVGPQLTAMSPALHSFEYKFGTHDQVEALRDTCAPGTTGPANCGWQPGLVGTGTPGARVEISLATGGVPMLLQVNQGIMAHDYPYSTPGACSGTPPGCVDPEVLALSVAGVANPSARFTITPSGIFNAQWTTAARDLLASGAKPVMTARVLGPGRVKFPADELDVFPARNRELTAAGNIFGEENIDPAMWSCESRLFFSDGPSYIRLCAASNVEFCTPCTRGFPPGGLKVIFPNAHLWLSRSWNSAQAYYQNRACSSDLSTCIASYEGYIDAFSFDATTARLRFPCLSQDFDRDTFRPVPYAGPPRHLHDAKSCFIGYSPSSSHELTTFFPNFNNLGSCAAVGPAAAASCSYTRKEPEPEDDD